METRLSIIPLGFGFKMFLHQPADPADRKPVAFVCIHSDGDYSDFPSCSQLSKRGFSVLGGRVSKPEGTMESKLLDVKKAVEAARKLPGIEKVLLIGHSGGATLMSCYQSVAEKGAQIYQTEKMIVPLELDEELPAADGMLILDSNYGNGVMTGLSVDPAVVDESTGVKLDKSLDSCDPSNGFSEDGTVYSEEFKKKFFAAQRARFDRLIDKALERYNAIKNGEGAFLDDEPFVAPGACIIKPNNKLINADISLLSHTEGEYPLIHADGSVTKEVVKCVRTPWGMKAPTAMMNMGAVNASVKNFLTNNTIRFTDEYEITETGIKGIDFDSSYCSTLGNVRFIDCPVLIMGYTAGYEYLAAETIWRNIGSKNKEIAFVEGANHNGGTEKQSEKFPGQYGDTLETGYEYAAKWAEKTFC